MGTPRAQQCTFLSMAYRPVNRQLNSMHKVCYSRGKHRWSETTKEAGKREINLILGSQKYFLEEQFSKMSVHRSTWKASGPSTPTAGSYPRVSASVSLGQNLRSCISNTLSSNTDAVGLEATLRTTILQEPKSQPTLLKEWSADQQLHNVRFIWKPARNVEIQVSPQIYWVRVSVKTLAWVRDFPGGSVVMNLPANAGDMGSIPGLGGKYENHIILYYIILYICKAKYAKAQWQKEQSGLSEWKGV